MTNRMAKLRSKPEGVYINQYEFELPSNVLKVLIDAAEWYRYVVLFENDMIYLCSLNKKGYDKIYKDRQGLIDFLDSLIFTFEETIDPYGKDEGLLGFVESYKDDREILNKFRLSLN